jgi:SET and MYND domain-containing protein
MDDLASLLPSTLRIETRPGRGRCVIAAVDIPAKTLALLSCPAATLPSSTGVCAACLREQPAARCKVCKTAYCDARCQKRGWPDHRHECKQLKLFLSKEGAEKVPVDVWMPMLLLARIFRGSRAGEALELGAPPAPEPPPPAAALAAAAAARFPSLAAVRALQPPPPPARAAAGTTQGIIMLGRTLELFPASATDAELAGVLEALQGNNFSPTDAALSPVGFGCFPAAALLNHSCRPNCCISYGFTGAAGWPLRAAAGAAAGAAGADPEAAPEPLRTVMAVRTLLPVKAGEELTHAYCDITQPKVARARDLLERYGFVCGCAGCSEEGGEAAAAGGGGGGGGDAADAALIARIKTMLLESRNIATNPTAKRELELGRERMARRARGSF